MSKSGPRILVFTTLFPHPGQPNAGLFIRERMFRVAAELPLMVVAPVPWFPLQGLIRNWRPHFRPAAPYREIQSGIEVLHPRFFSIPGIFKSLDGFFMALGALPTLLRLRQRFDYQIIDAHFVYPDGYAASLLGQWLGVPVTITLRGTEARLAGVPVMRELMLKALLQATRVFSVSDSLRLKVLSIGVPEGKVRVVGNGVDASKFQPVLQHQARRELGLPDQGLMLVSVGGLCERKGFHRVIDCLPELRRSFPDLRYLVVGGASAEGDWTERLKQQVSDLGLEEVVVFLGTMPPDRLKQPLSAADVFVLSTRNEGWANVFLEAMACGLPVVTTNVGGNVEVVCRPELGTIVAFDDSPALTLAIAAALRAQWDRKQIIDYAHANSWDQRVTALVSEFTQIAGDNGEQTSVSAPAIKG